MTTFTENGAIAVGIPESTVDSEGKIYKYDLVFAKSEKNVNVKHDEGFEVLVDEEFQDLQKVSVDVKGVKLESKPQRNSGRAALFFKTVRDLDVGQLRELLKLSLEEDVSDTIKLVFNIRDGIRGDGKGEKKLFYQCWKFLLDFGLGPILERNLFLVPFYGSFKDFLQIIEHLNYAPENDESSNEESAVKLFLNIKADKNIYQCHEDHLIRFYSKTLDRVWKLENGPKEDRKRVHRSIGLVAKWAPSENKHFDKKLGLAKKIRKNLSWSSIDYRKRLSALRKFEDELTKEDTDNYLHPYLVEHYICGKRLSEIDYSKVPGQAMKRYKKVFLRNDAQRYKQFMQNVKEVVMKRQENVTLDNIAEKNEDDLKFKLNTKSIFPHEIFQKMENARGNKEEVDTLETMWQSKLQDVRESLMKKHGLSKESILAGTICVADVSGSMSGLPLDVSVSLSIFLSQLVQGQFSGHVITFSNEPSFTVLKKNDTLQESFRKIKKMAWEMNTNIQAVFDLLLSTAVKYGISASEMPKIILILSDMEFDQATGSNQETNFEVIRRKFDEAKFPMPKLAFWNLRSSSVSFNMPVKEDAENVICVSGFNPNILNSFMSLDTPSPLHVIRKAIDDERYNKLNIPSVIQL